MTFSTLLNKLKKIPKLRSKLIRERRILIDNGATEKDAEETVITKYNNGEYPWQQ